MECTIYFDGAARANGSPGAEAAYAFVVYVGSSTSEMWRFYGCLGATTNNVAEFTAFVAAAQWFSKSGAGSADFFSDSELLVEAFHGRRVLRHPELRCLMTSAKAWLAMAGPVRLAHVAREGNVEADRSANCALDVGRTNFKLEDPLGWVVPLGLPKGWARFSPPRTGETDVPTRLLSARPSLTATLAGLEFPGPEDIVLPDHTEFVAGNLHSHLEQWKRVCSRTPTGEQVMRWVERGVDVHEFFAPFKGEFQGRHYDSDTPPAARFDNHALQPDLHAFVSAEVARELRIGAISVWGPVGEVTPPRLVLPVGVEPTKPRKLNDGRFLNLWCKDMPFAFEGLHMIPAVFDKGEYAFNVDHVSGYFHVRLTETSRTYFGFEWEAVYYVYNVLNFGWKPAPYVYTSFSGEVAGFLRRLALRQLYLLDDSLGAALERLATGTRDEDRRRSAGAAAFVTVSVMVALGYFVHPTKSVLVPAPALRWLGLLVRFDTGEFSVPEDKAAAISALLRGVLRGGTVHFKTLERVVGKLGSLSLAAPGILIKLRQMYASLTAAAKAGVWEVRLTPLLRAELEECLAMPFWTVSVAGWKSPAHLTVVLRAPESIQTGLGGTSPLIQRGGPSAAVTFWYPGSAVGSFSVTAPVGNPAGPHGVRRMGVQPVGDTVLFVLREALRRAGASDCFVTLLLHPDWRPRGVLSSDLSGGGAAARRADEYFDIVSAARVLVTALALPADSDRARFDSEKAHYRLDPALWEDVGRRFGPLQWDLMASDGNAQCGQDGRPLPHYTRWPSAGSSGVNVFSQLLAGREGLYANPVFAVLLPFLHLLRSQRASVVVVVPAWSGSLPSGPWWPLLEEFSTDRALLARRGTPGVFSQIDRQFQWVPAGPLPWDLWVYRFEPRRVGQGAQ